MTDRNAHGASLAACQTNVSVPIKPIVAIHIASEVARLVGAAHNREASAGKKVTHVSITPENVFIGYDGAVEVLGIPGMQRLQASPPNPNYYAPEQVSGSATDLRTEVFALGVVLWELFAGRPLFLRDTPAATRMAISEGRVPYVCDSNPEVPTPIADTLVTALRFDKHQRFESLEAFAKALVNARAASGISTAASKFDVGMWVSDRVPRPGGALSGGAGGVGASGGSGTYNAFGGPPPMSPPFAAGPPPMVPDLDFAAPPPRAPVVSAPPPSSRSPQPSFQPPPSVRSAAPPPKVDPSMGGGRAIAFDNNDDDDFDMEIERGSATSSLASASTSRAPHGGAGAGPRPSGGMRPGLELAQPSRMARAAAAEPQYAEEPSIALKLLGLVLSLVIAGGTAFSLWKYVYHARGFDITRRLPHAFDGTSASASGIVSLVALVLAVALGFAGLKLRPYAWALVGAGGLMLLVAIAMVTVTLGSTGENSVPPDGGLLVPYLFPSSILFVALGIAGRAGRRLAVAYGARKALFVPIAAIAGVVGYLAFEASRLAR